MIARAFLVLLLACAAVFTASCRDKSDAIPGAAIAVDDPFSGGYPLYEDENTGLRVIVGTPDLGEGTNRVTFALFDSEGSLTASSVEVVSRFYPDGNDDFEAGDSSTFPYSPYPDGGRGLYLGELTFDRPGLWAIEATLPGDAGAILFPIEVSEETKAPTVGDKALPSQNRTASDVSNLAELTTSIEPDPALYEQTIAQALEAERPIVVTFASPAFCTTPLCGPQVDVLSELREAHEGEASFIHVELYENPAEIRGDMSKVRRTPILEEWGLTTDQWTFVIDANGVITARFEGFASYDEVEAALLETLEG